MVKSRFYELKKVLLIISPVFWPKMPPLGIGYLQSFLNKKDIPTDILDLNNLFYNLSYPEFKKMWLISCNAPLEESIFSMMRNDFPEEFDSAIEEILKYAIVGFSCFKSNLKTSLEIIKILRSRKKDIRIILGGPEITRQYFKTSGLFEDSIKKLSDFIVAGEGELPLFEYITEKETGQKAVSFRESEDLSDFPFPDYRGLDLEKYSGNSAASILFSRGCVKKCVFCSERLLYRKFRMRKVEHVIQEIDYHRQNNKTNYFVFHDSMINADLKKLEILCDEIIKNFGSVNWEAQLYIRDDMDQRLFEKMKKSGCYNLFIGLESGCDKTLKNMKKDFTWKKALSIFKKIREAGLSFGVSIIIGYPGETKRDFQETLDFIIENKSLIPKIEQVNPFTYYDGTDADKNCDYSKNSESLERMNIFINEIKKHGLKHTNAFLGNLIEK